MDEACGFVRCCGWPFHFSNFHAFDELDLALSEVWTPWGGGRTWVLVMVVGVDGNFHGSGGGDDVLEELAAVAEDLWSWRCLVALSSGTSSWWSLGRCWPAGESNGSLP